VGARRRIVTSSSSASRDTRELDSRRGGGGPRPRLPLPLPNRALVPRSEIPHDCVHTRVGGSPERGGVYAGEKETRRSLPKGGYAEPDRAGRVVRTASTRASVSARTHGRLAAPHCAPCQIRLSAAYERWKGDSRARTVFREEEEEEERRGPAARRLLALAP